MDWIQVTPAPAAGRRRRASRTVAGSFGPPATNTVMPGSSRAGTSSGAMISGMVAFRCGPIAAGMRPDPGLEPAEPPWLDPHVAGRR